MSNKQISFNLKCDIFKQNLINEINNSDLPASVIYYIFKDVYNQVEKTYIGIINSELINNQEEQKQQILNEASEGKTE